MSIRAVIVVVTISMPSTLRAADNPRHVELKPRFTLKTLSQNWTDEQSNRFYNAAQGSRLVLYDCAQFKHNPEYAGRSKSR